LLCRRGKRRERSEQMQEPTLVNSEVGSEQRMWLAVIARTVEDWVGGPLRAQREADEYLFHDNKDFVTVCQAAGLDAGTLRGKLLRLKQGGRGPRPAQVMPKPQPIRFPVVPALGIAA